MNKKIIGKWRIVEMEQWDQDFIDTEVEAYITFHKKGVGSSNSAMCMVISIIGLPD